MLKAIKMMVPVHRPDDDETTSHVHVHVPLAKCAVSSAAPTPPLLTSRLLASIWQVPSLDALPDMRGWSAEDAKLAWRWRDDKKEFVVSAFGGTLHCTGWAEDQTDDEAAAAEAAAGSGGATAPVDVGNAPHPPPHPPQHPPPPSAAATAERKVGALLSGAARLGGRLQAQLASKLGRTPRPRLPPSAADPSTLAGVPLTTEEDVLHLRHLPEFGGALRPADVEVLLQMLLVPALRVPLLLRFFAEPSRTAALAVPELQRTLDAALFEPGAWQPPDVPKGLPLTIPAPTRAHLATPAGTLFQVRSTPALTPSRPGVNTLSPQAGCSHTRCTRACRS